MTGEAKVRNSDILSKTVTVGLFMYNGNHVSFVTRNLTKGVRCDINMNTEYTHNKM